MKMNRLSALFIALIFARAALGITYNVQSVAELENALESYQSAEEDCQIIVLEHEGGGFLYSIGSELSVLANQNGYSIVIAGTGGGQVILDGQEMTRLFRVSGNADVEFRNLTFTNGRATGPDPHGGAFLVQNSSIVFEACNFSNNTATGINCSGGAIESNSSSITILSSNFANNICSYSQTGNVNNAKGGAINVASGGLVTIAGGSMFVNNECCYTGDTFSGEDLSYGGAIAVNECELEISGDCLFLSNRCYYRPFDIDIYIGYGGAIYSVDSDINYSNVEFTENHAENGGAIKADPGLFRSSAIENCRFEENSATGYGGAISLSEFTHDVGIQQPIIEDTWFEGNSAAYGGVLSCGYVRLENCDFISNSGSVNAGAIYGSSSFIVSDCRFSLNVANGYDGGAIYIDTPIDELSIGINESIFESCSAAYGFGGAVCLASGGLILDSSVFSENMAGDGGGAVSSKSHKNGETEADISMLHCIFRSNTVDGEDDVRGGALYNTGKLSITDCEFIQNGLIVGYGNDNDVISGGALYSEATQIDVYMSLFAQNYGYFHYTSSTGCRINEQASVCLNQTMCCILG